MCHLSLRSKLSSVFVAVLIVIGATSTSAQNAPKKESVWDKIKKTAQQGAQQGQQQPGQSPQQQPGQRSQRSGQQQPAASAPSSASGPIRPPAGTKIEEKVMAPIQQGATFEISPHGVHLATIETSGSRAVVFYDGVEGPKFDQILADPSGQNTRIVFSPDGNRYAYCARTGDQYVVMVDGKELVRSSESNDGRFDGNSCHLGFTSNSKHVYYSSQVNQGSERGKTFTRFVFDGKPSPTGSVDNGVAFSPDGDHFAYVLTIGDPYHQDRFALVVDGKPAPYVAGAPQWSADSKHLYTQMQVPLGPRQGQGTDLLLDGKPIARAYGFTLYVPPVGDMAIAVVRGGTTFEPVQFLTVAGKRVPGSDIGRQGAIDQVVFSPDGKHYAALFRYQSVKRWLMVDGKKQLEYQGIDHISFTPDSSKVAYQASANGKTFLVVGDQESDGLPFAVLEPIVAPVGNRVAALFAGGGSTPSVFIDGKNIPVQARGLDKFSFSPDGAHYSYVMLDSGMGKRLAIDGVPQQASNFGGAISPIGVDYTFSPDSKHIAHFALPPNPTGEQGMFLDGKYIPQGSGMVRGRLKFTPDSKHLIWFQQVPSSYDFIVFVDGKAVVRASPASNRGINDLSAASGFDISPDGTLLILVQDDNSIKRISITPSPETGVPQMLGGGTAVASGR